MDIVVKVLVHDTVNSKRFAYAVRTCYFKKNLDCSQIYGLLCTIFLTTHDDSWTENIHRLIPKCGRNISENMAVSTSLINYHKPEKYV